MKQRVELALEPEEEVAAGLMGSQWSELFFDDLWLLDRDEHSALCGFGRHVVRVECGCPAVDGGLASVEPGRVSDQLCAPVSELCLAL